MKTAVVLGVLCEVVGVFLIRGVSIEFPGIILGYYFGLQSSTRVSCRISQRVAGSRSCADRAVST